MMKHVAVHLSFVCLGQYIWVHEQSVNPKKGGLDVMYVKSLTVQNAFQSIPSLISCAGVTGRWELISHSQNAVRWLALSIPQAEAPQM